MNEYGDANYSDESNSLLQAVNLGMSLDIGEGNNSISNRNS